MKIEFILRKKTFRFWICIQFYLKLWVSFKAAIIHKQSHMPYHFEIMSSTLKADAIETGRTGSLQIKKKEW